MAIACRMCIATRGLRGSEIGSLPQTEEELVEHLENVHHMIVTREGETDEEAAARVRAKIGPCQECDEARVNEGHARS